MVQPSVQAAGVGKFYPVVLTAGRLLRYLWPKPLSFHPHDFWAVRNVSFELQKGQVLGIIGRNGSGKSTLLQMVAGLLEPSEGSIRVSGNTAAMLELGAGFNPEFTGQENIFLSGAVYGFSRKEMRKKYDEIAHFAGIGEHLDQPVKTYSSGMFTRLAFAVAIQVDPDILIVDEILSVGDIAFQAKCFRRIEQLKNDGTSILFVSHDLNRVQTLCDQAILLDRGQMITMDEPKKVTDAYLYLMSSEGQFSERAGEAMRGTQTQSSRARIDNVELINSNGISTIHPKAGERCRLRYTVHFYDDIQNPVVTFQLKTMLGSVISDQTNLYFNAPLPPCIKGEQLQVEFGATLNLCPGAYRVGVSIADVQKEVPIPVFGKEMLTLEVISDKKASGIAFLDASFSYLKTADLAAEEQ